jgi:hypothetical protein
MDGPATGRKDLGPLAAPSRSSSRSPAAGKASARHADGLALTRARRLRRSGRTVALGSFALYVAGLLAFALALDHWHPNHGSGGIVKLEQLRRLVGRQPDRPLVVMLGSSRTYGMFRARSLAELSGPDGKPVVAYNYGVPTFGPMQEYLLLRGMLKAGIRPRMLLLEVLPPLLNEPRQGVTSEEEWAQSEWLNVSQLLALKPYLTSPGKMKVWLEARLAPWCTFRFWIRETVLEWLGRRHVPLWNDMCDEHGYQLPEWLSDAQYARRREKARQEFEESLRHFRLGRGPTQALRDLLACCRRENLPVVLIVPPESSEFRGWYAPGGLASVRELLDELRQAPGVRLIDASAWVEDNDFGDGHHVLADGARTFTSRLIEELRPLVANPDRSYQPSSPGSAPAQ